MSICDLKGHTCCSRKEEVAELVRGSGLSQTREENIGAHIDRCACCDRQYRELRKEVETRSANNLFVSVVAPAALTSKSSMRGNVAERNRNLAKIDRKVEISAWAIIIGLVLATLIVEFYLH